MPGYLGLVPFFVAVGLEGSADSGNVYCRSVISSEHGGCVIIPREDGYIRYFSPGVLTAQLG